MKPLRLLAALFLASLLHILGQSTAYADDVVPPAPEQVVVSPAQAAVNTALATATTEVAQAVTASTTASTATQIGFYSDHKLINFVVELTDPHYDAKSKTLTYIAKPLKGSEIPTINSLTLHHVYLFIDDVCLSCWGN